jgi:hypothetical protein
MCQRNTRRWTNEPNFTLSLKTKKKMVDQSDANRGSHIRRFFYPYNELDKGCGTINLALSSGLPQEGKSVVLQTIPRVLINLSEWFSAKWIVLKLFRGPQFFRWNNEVFFILKLVVETFLLRDSRGQSFISTASVTFKEKSRNERRGRFFHWKLLLWKGYVLN